MKRFITMIVAVCAFFAVSAQNPMVTLSHNGELSFFTNIGAFKTAYDAAENGDILYLSVGDFILDGGKIAIEKRLSIVGSGYDTHILGDISFKLDTPYEMNAPLFDGVRLDDIEFNVLNSYYKNIGQSEILRSWIRTVEYADYAGTDVLYDKCYLEKIICYNSRGGNVILRNSKIGYLEGGYNVTVENCNINDADYYPRSMTSSIFNKNSKCATSGKHSIFNSLLNLNHDNTQVTKYDCYINSDASLLNDKLESTIDLTANSYFGKDGTTEVGIHGGESPFSENPSVPTVDSSKSSVEYDAASNKLKVSITVKAD